MLFLLAVLVIVSGVLFFLNQQNKSAAPAAPQVLILEETDASQDNSKPISDEKREDSDLNTTEETQGENHTVDETSPSSSEVQQVPEEELISTYDGSQDDARRFVAYYLTFNKEKFTQVEKLLAPSAYDKVKNAMGEVEQEVSEIELLDRSNGMENTIFVYTFQAAFKDRQKTKKVGKIFLVLDTQSGKTEEIITDVEWAYDN